MHSLVAFWKEHDLLLNHLGLEVAERDKLFEVGVPIELERTLTNSPLALPEYPMEKAQMYFRQKKSPFKIYADLRFRVVAAARKYATYRNQSLPLAAATIAINNCCFGEMDNGIGRFERLSEHGHGAGNYLVVKPEEKFGRELWWCLAELAEFSPVIVEPSGRDVIRCTVNGQPPIELTPDSKFLGKGSLFSVDRIFELIQAGRHQAFFGALFDVPSKPPELFLQYPVAIKGSLKKWNRVFAGFQHLTKKVKVRRDWLAELGVSESDIAAFLRNEVDVRG